MNRFGNVSSREMCEGKLFPNIIKYTVPIILTSVLQLLFNAADMIIVGQFNGKTSVAAVGATGAIINLIITLFVGLSVGSGASVARALGARRKDEVHRIVHTSIPVALVGGVILTVVGLVFCRTFLEWMDTPADVIDLSTIYMKYYFAGMTGSMLFNFGAAILRAAGDTQSPLIYLTISGFVNVILNIVFVRFCDMNVAGVALATAITQALSAALTLWALVKRDDSVHLDFKKLHVYKRELLTIIRIGLPAGLQGSLFSFSNVIIQSSVNSFGSIAMSGNSAAANIEGFVYVTMNAFHQSALTFGGQNCGAKKPDNVHKVAKYCLLDVTVAGLLAGNLAYLLGPYLLQLYITDSPEAIAFGLMRMSIVSVIYFLCGLQDVMTGLLRGMGASFVPMLISVIGVCGVRLLWINTIFQMEQFHTLRGLFISYPVSWILVFAAELVAYFVLWKKMKKKWAAEATLAEKASEKG